MYIISATPSAAGQYPAIQQTNRAEPPEGFLWWPDSLEQQTFLRYEGFVILTIQRNTVASYAPNEEAYEAWKASHPDPGPEPTDTEILNTLLGVTE